jgi:stage V sporulation protein B
MVPKRLMKNAAIKQPLAAFGTVSGMVFPVILFPACILFALAELLIPEFARCTASNSHQRIGYLTRRSLKIALIYGLLFSGLIYLSSETLCSLLYGNTDAAFHMKQYAILIPMLYCDTITDAITKGLGQQKVCVQYNILTSALDVIFLYLLLPRYGMAGYFFSFAITHLINFLLSFRRLLRITNQSIPFSIPAFSIPAAIISVILADMLPICIGKLVAFPALFASMLTLFQVLGHEDFLWLFQLCFRSQNTEKNSVLPNAAR